MPSQYDLTLYTAAFRITKTTDNMRFDWFFFVLPLVWASPLLNSSDVSAGPPTTEEKALSRRWIITLNKGSLVNDVLDFLLAGFGVERRNLIYTYDMPDFQAFVIEVPGFFLRLPRQDPSTGSIKAIEEDSVVNISAITTQNNAPYGLARLSTRANATGTVYNYDSTAGAGTFAYVLDTVRYPVAYCVCVDLKGETADHLF